MYGNQSPSCHSAERKTPLSPFPASKTCHDMGLRTVFTVQMLPQKRLFNMHGTNMPLSRMKNLHSAMPHIKELQISD
ncbi:hypothetical protein TNCV_4621401 [Trichonephila clavipes]|nr:hypothetical protein TNCV_4621401 [Trichonephila clavipes]